MKYLVNRHTKEHQIATPLAESIIKGYPDFRDDWQLVEADSEGWIPWSGGDCPLPYDCECEIKRKYMREPSISSRAYGWDWAHDHYKAIIAYRPVLAEQKPDNHLDEDTTRRINEGSHRRFEEARTANTPASVFDRFKSAIAASESIPGIIAEIDALLPEAYEVTKRPTFRNVEI